MKKILGLDLGTNSIGWAIVEKEKGCFNLVKKGVHIFQEGVKIEKGIEGSKAAERTKFRSARRIKYRRRIRKINTLQILSEYGYCPKLTKTELLNWRYKKVYPISENFRNWYKTNDFLNQTPYYYRNLIINSKLDTSDECNRFAIGRALYHMTQRRGFISNRLERTKENDGKVNTSINEINEKKGDLTLGQYLYQKNLNGEKIRDIYTHRDEHYLDEFNRIVNFQHLPSDFVEKLKKAIFFQRPLKSQKGLVGKCVFEKNKPRCPVSRPEFEEYRMLCFINNIKIRTPQDERLRPLNRIEREAISPLFYRKRKPYFDFEEIAKKLAPKNQYKYFRARNIHPNDWLFNYDLNTTVSACPVSARFIEVFGQDFAGIKFEYQREKDNKTSSIDINDIWHAIYKFDSEERLIAFAENRLHLDKGKLKSFLDIHFKKEFASLSLKAINKILPFLREGLIYSHAVFLANLGSVLPKRIWDCEEDRETIKNEFGNIIKTQSEEDKIIGIVNGLIKENRENDFKYNIEAATIYQKELNRRIRKSYGENFDNDKRERIEEYAFSLFKKYMIKSFDKGEFIKSQMIYERIKTFLIDNFSVQEVALEKLYHPSAVEVYKPCINGVDGKKFLGSPMVSSIRNPMAMRSLHQLRRLINELIRNGEITSDTTIHIEMARDLMNANERKALKSWQRDRENVRKNYIDRITEYYRSNDVKIEPSNDEILKFQLWEEQNHKCLYTGKEIAVSDFLGDNIKYDIEHTIPRSLSFDNSQENKTLCDNYYNRNTKINRIPYELENYDDIIERIQPWKDKIDTLDYQIQIAVRQSKASIDKEEKDKAIEKRHRLRYERRYWGNKYKKFLMCDVPEGFKNSQLVDTGIITKYARLYLNTLFNKVYTVKGGIVADFRIIWGLQNEYEKKSRTNHIHHCIDAITIACITKDNYERLARFYHDWENLERAGISKKPSFEKPWNTFTEDMRKIENNVLVSHYTPDVLYKQSKRKLRKRGRIQLNDKERPIYLQGDTARGSLHKETFYKAIKTNIVSKTKEIQEEIRYVVRKKVETLEDSNICNIVDNHVREIIEKGRREEKTYRSELEVLRKKLSKAEEHEESELRNEINEVLKRISKLYCLPNKNGEPVHIKKVRVFTPSVTNPIHLKKQRDKSRKSSKPHKEHYHVVNDGNYMMAIYEGKDDKGNIKRDFEIVSNMQASEYFKLSVHQELKLQGIQSLDGLVASNKKYGNSYLKLKGVLKTGTLVLFYQNDPEEILLHDKGDINFFLYKVVKLNKDGRITFKFHQEARTDEMLKTDYETMHGEKAPKSLTNGISKIDFNVFSPKLLISPSNLNILIQSYDFTLTVLGEIKLLKDA